MMILEISSWAEFKSLCITSKGLSCQYNDLGSAYTIIGPDANGIVWRTGIAITDPRNEDQIDFEDNYKSGFNLPITVPSQERGFQDLTGHNVYRLGHMNYLAVAGETTIFMEKFASTMYLQGGGVDIPEYTYVSGVKTDNKPEHGDECTFDLVDVDNVTGYTKSFDISKVARSSNVATITTSTEHNFVTDEVCCINPNDDTFDDLEVAITVVDSTHITYPNTGDDVAEKDATGKIGKILVLAPFVPQDYVYPGMVWDCMCNDAKAVPAGIYLRFKYISTGDSDVIVMPHYKLRT